MCREETLKISELHTAKVYVLNYMFTVSWLLDLLCIIFTLESRLRKNPHLEH